MKEMTKHLSDLNFYRKFPRFQLERHFDVILLNYITNIINHFSEKSCFTVVVPEYPVSKQLLQQTCRSSMESIAVDYAIFDLVSKKVAVVELKTEPGSNRDVQDKYLETISKLTSKNLLEFIIKRVEHKPRNQAQAKYKFLLNYLNEQNCVNEFLNDNPITVYKISPKNEKLKDYISFKDIVENVKIPNDPLWQEICKYLIEWNEPMTVESLSKASSNDTVS